MELIPIIKLTLVIFATVVFFVILISYMIYKAKEKRTVRPWNKENERENIGKSHRKAQFLPEMPCNRL